ncbi:unnamed protein product, partial [Candidula unifasciata]
LVAEYNASQDKLVVVKAPSTCDHCRDKQLRLVRLDYTIEYINGDRTSTKSSKSPSGFKHFWNGIEYDTHPIQLPVVMEWRDRRVETKVLWFQDEEDPSLNSNVYSIAMNLVQENFPGEFGSERLVQKVVDQILRQTNKPETEKSQAKASRLKSSGASNSLDDDDDSGGFSPHRASKAIITGSQRHSIHKEELNKSATERKIKQRIEANAPKQQRKLSDQSERKHSSPSPEGSSRRTPDRRFSSPSSLSSSRVPPVSTTAQSAATTAGAVSSVAGESGGAREVVDTSKRIRLSTSDGRNVTLDLPSECTFLELQNLIHQATGVPPAQQCIRHGFPPRELKPPASSAEDYKVPVQPGDKIMLVSKLEPSSGDNLDHSLSALALTAALDNKDLWTYVQQRPHLFSVNGLFYKQVERDMGLIHGKHCQLPMLSHKLFAYNQHDDRLELCLEPYGHFPIESNVEKHAGSMLPASKCSGKSQNQPFSGQGHSLRSGTSPEERMPTDVPMSPKRHEARRLNTLCDPTKHQESIEEEDEVAMEETQEDHNTPKASQHSLCPLQVTRNHPTTWNTPGSLNLLAAPEPRLIRKGPGYSELSPIPENVSNEKIELLQHLVSRIEQACEEMGQEAQKISEAGRLTPADVLSPLSPTVAAVCSANVATSGHLVCTSSSLPCYAVEHPTSKTSVCDISSSSSARTAAHVIHTASQSPTACSSDPSSTIVFHQFPQSRTDTGGSAVTVIGSETGLVTALLSPDNDKCTDFLPGGAECHGQDSSQEGNVEGVVTDSDLSHSAVQVKMVEMKPSDRPEGSGDGDTRPDLVCQENMEAEEQGRESECQGEGVESMDTECVKEDHRTVPMDDEEECRPEQTSQGLDDLFIVEPTVDLPESGLISDSDV